MVMETPQPPPTPPPVKPMNRRELYRAQARKLAMRHRQVHGPPEAALAALRAEKVNNIEKTELRPKSEALSLVVQEETQVGNKVEDDSYAGAGPESGAAADDHDSSPTEKEGLSTLVAALDELPTSKTEGGAPKLTSPQATSEACVRSVLGRVLARFKDQCQKLRVKTNSKVLKGIEAARVVRLRREGHDRPGFTTFYDFSHANLGDRGAVAALLGLAADPFLGFVSLRSCGLRNGSATAIAEFVKRHPSLLSMDLSENAFSYSAGQELLRALECRGQEADKFSLNLHGNALAFDKAGSGPPCGHLTRNNPRNGSVTFMYEELRAHLDEAHGAASVCYKRTPSHSPQPRQGSRRSSPDKGRGSTPTASATKSTFVDRFRKQLVSGSRLSVTLDEQVPPT